MSEPQVVGHREDDFDFHPFLSHIFPYVTNILIYLIRIGDPETSLLIHAQVIQKLEEHSFFLLRFAFTIPVSSSLVFHHTAG
jgi:hypothetical protein